ncbi:pentapeptide repeat-containing protein, partial [Synechococcus sp. UW140]
MDYAGNAPLPTSLDGLRQQLSEGRLCFPGLQLEEVNFADLELAGCDLGNGDFKASRFGHGRLAGALLNDACLHQALLWGADLSECQAQGSQWHEADLSGARLQGA